MKTLFNLTLFISVFFISGCTQKYLHNQYTKAQAKRVQYVNSKKLTDDVRWAILNANLAIGMTKSDVIAVKGYPNRINKTNFKMAIEETWMYGYNSHSIFIARDYLYFRNSILFAVQR